MLSWKKIFITEVIEKIIIFIWDSESPYSMQ